MTADLESYLALIPSANRDRPKFIAAVSASIQPLVDAQNLALSLQTIFDLDVAVGDQLDKTGEWVGLTRFIAEPLQVLYFALDTPGAGLDQAVWYEPNQPIANQIDRLDDNHYRLLLKARVAANIWDGTIPGAYAAWQTLFGPEGFQILIQNVGPKVVPWFALDKPGAGLDQSSWYPGFTINANDGMHIILALVGPPLDALTYQLFVGGYLELRPAGVQVDAYATQSIPGVPIFALDVPNPPAHILSELGVFLLAEDGTELLTEGNDNAPPYLAGLDIGAWATMTLPTI